MVPTPPQTGTDAGALIRGAAARLSDRARELPGAGGRRVRRSDILEHLEWVSAAAQALLAGEEPDFAGAGDVGRAVSLVHALRSEILKVGRVPQEPATLVDAMRALEHLSDRLTGDDPDDLRSRLAGPDAFELLVEVAHDLRSPLTSILFLSETLRSGHSGPVNDHQRGQLGLIYSAALGLVSMASDVVDLARNQEGVLDQEPEAFSIRDVLQNVEEMVRPMAQEKQIDLTLSTPQYDRGYGLPIALTRVLLNLTTNGVKFTDSGFVELGAERHGRRQWEFWVRDTGRGIPAERREDLFQPFKKRGAGRGHFFSGSGVGLSIARRLVHAMGSELQLETEPGWGTRFSFRIDAHSLD
jgi:signal transduction histidine kinase